MVLPGESHVTVTQVQTASAVHILQVYEQVPWFAAVPSHLAGRARGRPPPCVPHSPCVYFFWEAAWHRILQESWKHHFKPLILVRCKPQIWERMVSSQKQAGRCSAPHDCLLMSAMSFAFKFPMIPTLVIPPSLGFALPVLPPLHGPLNPPPPVSPFLS